MARNLSAATIATLATTTGLEPYNIIETSFGLFADKTIGEIQGRVISIGSMDNATRFDGVGSSGSVSVVLSDIDGYLFQIWSNYNLHNDPVTIRQAFRQLPPEENFPVFEGFISTPITYDESTRVLSFDIVTKIEDYLAGFSPEDGQIKNLRWDQVGKPWPMAFGQAYVPALPIQTIPTAILLSAFGIPDGGIFVQIYRNGLQAASLQNDFNNKQNTLLFPNDPFGEHSLDEINAALEQRAQAIAAEAKAYQDAKNQVAKANASLLATLTDQEKWTPGNRYGGVLRIAMTQDFPAGNFLVKINDAMFNAEISRVDSQTGTMTVKYVQQQLTDTVDPLLAGLGRINVGGIVLNFTGGDDKKGFQFFNSGSAINIISEYKIPYVCNILPSQVLGVYAYRSYNGAKVLTQVPADYYTVTTGSPDYSTNDSVIPGTTEAENLYNALVLDAPTTGNILTPQVASTGWFAPTFINMKRPLSLVSFFVDQETTRVQDIIEQTAQLFGAPVASKVLPTEEWDDEYFVLIQSPIGPNIVDIMQWIIEKFTVLGIDETSFNIARNYLQKYPANFVLLEQKETYSLLSELALQARCAIYLRDDTFFLKYLPAEGDPVDTISSTDIIEGSLQFSLTDDSQIVTYYTATWRANYLPQSQVNKVVVKMNIAKYNIRKEEQDYYIYNQHYEVKKSATFWLMRKSNSWKQLSFKCPLTKLNIETFDTVLINLPDWGILVKGIVQSAVYDSSDNTIAFLVWLPIVAGTTVSHRLAFPANASEVDVYPTEQDILSGGGTQNFIQYQPMTFRNESSMGSSEIGGIYEPTNSESWIMDTTFRPDSYGTPLLADANDPGEFSDEVTPMSSPEGVAAPSFAYKLQDVNYQGPPADTVTQSNGVWPGFVNSKADDGSYLVDVFKNGQNEDSESLTVTQLQINSNETIPQGTAVLVCEVIDTKVTPSKTSYVMQVPVWLFDPTM